MSNVLISILAGLGGMFGWGISDFFANQTTDRIGHSKTFFWSQMVGLIFLSIIVILVSPSFAGISTLFGFFLLTSLSYTVAYLFFYKAFEVGNVSVVSASINLNVVMAMVLAIIFKGQRLTGYQPLAVVLILFGITLVSVKLKELKNSKVSLAAGMKEVLIASLVFGAYWNLAEYVAEQSGWLVMAFGVKALSLIILLIWSLLKRESMAYQRKNLSIFPLVALVGVLEALAIASTSYGIEVGDLVLVSPISSALSIVTITMAVIFLKERLTKVQWSGIAITIIGIVLSAF